MINLRSTASKFLLGATLAGLTLGSAGLHAQAQSLLSSNQVVVSRVENIDPTTILISGVNFDKFGNPPVVSLSASGTNVTAIPAAYNATEKDITATLPDNVAWIPGSYRLMVSFGPGTAATDVFEFTVGAVGPQGDKGEQGIQGIQGEKGDQGIQGVQGLQGIQGEKGDKGDKGDQGVQGIQGTQGVQGVRGEKGDKGDKGDTGATGATGAIGATGPVGPRGQSGNFPVFQNVTAARAAGIAIGQIWVQESSGQVFQMVK